MIKEKTKEKEFYVAPFNDCKCRGHTNWMLDCTFKEEGDRKTLAKTLDNYIEKETA